MTGDEPQIKRLAQAVGFRYAYDSESKQFAHASVIMMLTPEGRLSRYFYGIQYPAARHTAGPRGSVAGKDQLARSTQILLFCYHYDPHTGKYGLLISRVIQLAGPLTVVIGGIFLVVMFRGEHYTLPGGRADERDDAATASRERKLTER